MNHRYMGKSTPYYVLGVQHTTCLFLIWRVRVVVSVIARLSHPGLIDLRTNICSFYFVFFMAC